MAPPIDFKLLITSALAFAAALSWNDAVETSLRRLYPAGSAKSAHMTVVYAIVVTIIIILVVAAINYLSRVAERLHRQHHGPPEPEKDSYTGPNPSLKHLPRAVNIQWPTYWT